MKLIFRHTYRKQNGIVGIGSWLIRKIDKAVLPSGFVADHVAFYDEKLKVIYEAHRKEGVRCVVLEQWEKELQGGFNYAIMPIETRYKFKALHSRIMDLKGVKYDYLSLVLQWIYIKTSLWIGRKGNAYNAFVCSEFVDYCLNGSKWWKSSVRDVINKHVNKPKPNRY